MRKLAVLVAVLGLATMACGGSGDPPPDLSFGPEAREGDVEVAAGSAALVSFEACDQLLDYVHEETIDLVGPYGIEGMAGIGFAVGGDVMAVEDSAGAGEAGGGAPATTTAPQRSAAGEAGQDFSGTNVQVQGVDEPDLVKTDGELLIAAGQARLHVIDVSGDQPRKLAEVDLRQQGWDHQLMLDGDRLLVLTRGQGPLPTGVAEDAGDAAREGISMPAPGAESTTVTVIDLSAPAAPKTVSTLTLEGSYVSARMVDGVVRIVTRSQPTAMPFEYPVEGTPAAELRAAEHNRDVVESSTVEDWLPSYVLETGDAVSSGQLVGCDQVHHPVEFSGPGTLTVVTVDPDDPRPGNAVSILSGAETVYASAEALYVATTDWEQMRIMSTGEAPVSDASTQIHKFDISDAAATRYVASGAITGTLLNQFAMDEHEGNLRVASTGGTESFVTVLGQQGEQLVEVGKVGGLGRDERIYSVRFIGDLGYVVTFRQVDPLYVVDLSNPAAPAVRGELKILGYSAYLHPMGDDLLLGVGQDASEEGRVQGTQLAVFDVSDPANPRRVHQLRVDSASSEAEYDHHAFLYWPATGLTVLPVQTYTDTSFWSGAIAFDVDAGSGISEQGRITHMRTPEDYLGQIRRSIVVGDALYTLSERGLMASDLDALTERAFVEFPALEQ